MDLFDISVARKLAGGGGGGGGSSYKLLASAELEITGVTSSQQKYGEFEIDEAWTSSKIIYIRIRDTAGQRGGYLYGCDYWFINQNPANGSTDSMVAANFIGVMYPYKTSSQPNYVLAANGTVTSGIYYLPPGENFRKIRIYAKTNSSVGTINGTYLVEVYALDWPGGVSPFTT